MSENKGRPRKYKTPEEMQVAIDEYFDKCVPTPMTYKDENGEDKQVFDRNGIPVFKLNPPTHEGLALHLGFASRQSLYDYEGYDKEYSYTIKRARTIITKIIAEGGLEGNIPAAVSIFHLKNLGYTDSQKIEHSGEVSNTFSLIGVNAENKDS